MSRHYSIIENQKQIQVGNIIAALKSQTTDFWAPDNGLDYWIGLNLGSWDLVEVWKVLPAVVNC